MQPIKTSSDCCCSTKLPGNACVKETGNIFLTCLHYPIFQSYFRNSSDIVLKVINYRMCQQQLLSPQWHLTFVGVQDFFVYFEILYHLMLKLIINNTFCYCCLLKVIVDNYIESNLSKVDSSVKFKSFKVEAPSWCKIKYWWKFSSCETFTCWLWCVPTWW